MVFKNTQAENYTSKNQKINSNHTKILLLLEKQLYLVKFLCYNYYIEIYKLRKQIADEIYNDIAKIVVFMEG